MSSIKTMQEYINEIKLELTGNVLELELSDKTLEQVVNKALKEIQRYIDTTRLITVPYAQCIDLTDFNCSSVIAIYRTKGIISSNEDSATKNASNIDPFQAQMWQVFSNNGSMYKMQDYIMNYLSYNTLMQMRNTLSTDLAFKEDKDANKLYISCGMDFPTSITIEYVPKVASVEDVKSDYWQDVLQRLSTDLVKVMLGHIRTRYVQSNALWTQDGESMLNEGTTDLKELREILRVNSNLFIVKD